MPIGPVLREFRKMRGLTIEEVARRADVHWVYYGDIERSKENPTVRVLDRILTALQLEWGEFGSALDRKR